MSVEEFKLALLRISSELEIRPCAAPERCSSTIQMEDWRRRVYSDEEVAKRKAAMQSVLEEFGDVNLAGENLQGIDLRFASLEGKDLRGAQLTLAHLDFATADQVCFDDAVLVGASCNGFMSRNASFNRANFQLAMVNVGGLYLSKFEGANFDQTSLEETYLNEATFDTIEPFALKPLRKSGDLCKSLFSYVKDALCSGDGDEEEASDGGDGPEGEGPDDSADGYCCLTCGDVSEAVEAEGLSKIAEGQEAVEGYCLNLLDGAEAECGKKLEAMIGSLSKAAQAKLRKGDKEMQSRMKGFEKLIETQKHALAKTNSTQSEKAQAAKAFAVAADAMNKIATSGMDAALGILEASGEQSLISGFLQHQLKQRTGYSAGGIGTTIKQTLMISKHQLQSDSQELDVLEELMTALSLRSITQNDWDDHCAAWKTALQTCKSFGGDRSRSMAAQIFGGSEISQVLGMAFQLENLNDPTRPPPNLMKRIKGMQKNLKTKLPDIMTAIRKERLSIQRIERYKQRLIAGVGTAIVSAAVGLGNFVADVAFADYTRNS